MNLLKKYLLSSVAFAPETEAGTEKPAKTNAELQRESIKVESTNDEPVVEAKKEEAEGNEEQTDDDKGDEGEKEEAEGESGESDGEKEIEAKEDSPEKLKRTIDRLQRRVGKTAGEKAELAKQLKAAQDALTAKDAEGDKFTKEDVKREAELIAKRTQLKNDFVNDCNKLDREAKKINPKFGEQVKEMADDLGPIPTEMIGILADLDNGAAVLNYLTNNVEDAEDIYKLSVGKMSARLAKIGLKLEAEAKPKPKQHSKVPPPNKEIDGSNRGTDTIVLLDNEPMENWVEKRNRQIAQKKANGMLRNLQ